MNVSQFMETGLLQVPPATTAANAAREMERRQVDCAVVTDRHFAAVGIVTATDLVRHLAAGGKERVPVGQVMSRSVWAVDIDADVEDALAIMDLRGIHHVLVVDFGGYPVGMLFRDDLIDLGSNETLTVDDALRVSTASSDRAEHSGVGAQQRRREMQAHPGDRIIIKGQKLGEPNRDGRVIEAHGADCGPPYVVEWSDSGRQTLFFPGAEATVEHFETAGAR